MPSPLKIQPHWDSKTTADICAVGKTVYIIRSDLKCYMVTSDLKTGRKTAVYALHHTCQWGEHYFANSKGFYIIKGDQVHFVKDLSTGIGCKEFTLHKNCQGGTHYASLRIVKKRFIIIWVDQEKSKAKARVVQNLETDLKGREFSLANDCKDGTYFWGSQNLLLPGYKFLMPVKGWGQAYQFTRNLERNVPKTGQPVSEVILPFLPGGLTISLQASSKGSWKLLKSFKNKSNAEFHWEHTIKHTVGYEKKELESIERHWDVKCKFQAGIAAVIAKLQLSMEASYGGSKTKTTEEEWTNSTEEEEKITVVIPIGETVYIWQYQLGFGDKPVLFTRSIQTTFSSAPPTDNPLNTD